MFGWEKEIWIAHRIKVEKDDYGNEIEYFDKPKRYFINYQPVSGYTSFLQYGANSVDVYRAFVDRQSFSGVIKKYDRAYLSDGDISEEELQELAQSDNEFCEKANYRVEIVLPQNVKTKIDFKKRI